MISLLPREKEGPAPQAREDEGRGARRWPFNPLTRPPAAVDLSHGRGG